MNYKVWIQAARPKTLINSAAPVIVASALAYKFDGFQLLPAVYAFLFALFCQILANYANDYFDYKKGADTEKRKGPTRVMAAGLVTEKQMLVAMCIVSGIALGSGLMLIPYGGLWLIGIGVASLISAVAYTGGPYPLGYHGFGDLFVFIFFGLVAVMMTFYVQTGYINYDALWIGAACGVLSANVLAVTSYRDIDTDTEAGKETLAVKFGPAFVETQYIFSFIFALTVPILLLMGDSAYYNISVVLPWVLVIPAFKMIKRWVRQKSDMCFETGLKASVGILMGYAVLLSFGLVLSR